MEVKTSAIFRCSCEGELTNPKAIRTHDEKLFIVCRCLACGNPVLLEINEIIATLYDAVLAPGGKEVS